MHSSSDFLKFPGRAHVPCKFQSSLRFHLVAAVLISCNGKLLGDNIAHVHEILQTLLQDFLNIHIICTLLSAFSPLAATRRQGKEKNNIP